MLSERLEIDATKLKKEELPIEVIEYHLRKLPLSGHTEYITTELIKRYMIRYFGKTDEDLEDFSIARMIAGKKHRNDLRFGDGNPHWDVGASYKAERNDD